MATDIKKYLKDLPSEFQQRSNELLPRVFSVVSAWRSRMEGQTDEELAGIDELVFTSSGQHPEYCDMDAIFSIAFDQLVLHQRPQTCEIPLIFIGYHSMNRFTGKRQSLGFLLTNQMLYIQDQSSMFFEYPQPRIEILPLDKLVARHVLARHFSYFEWEESMIRPKQREELLQLLTEVFNSLIDYNCLHGIQIEAVKEKPSIDHLVQSLALQDQIKNRHQLEKTKLLARVSNNFQIPAEENILFAVIDKPLFGGPYGFTITCNNLYSRDFLEAPQAIPFSEICADGGLRLTDDKKNLITSEKQVIFLPSHLKTSDVRQVRSLIYGAIELIQAGTITD
ncbi:hypothetical protein [Citrobacter meridianamericanus]|uniref:hypothetical protein n=1 Tax=Citrobacter meridianamericanus TaxID=2894201 RepID=UPI00351D4F9F